MNDKKNTQTAAPDSIRNSQNPYCYISCDSNAGSRVAAICREIRAMGGDFRHDNGSLTGDEWLRQTTDRINGCHEYIVFVTKSLLARENRYVRNEFFFAKKAGKKMYAVMLDMITPDDVDESLKKWFGEINQRCGVITPSADASPRETAELMNETIHFSSVRQETPAPKSEEKSQSKPEQTDKTEGDEVSSDKKEPTAVLKRSNKKTALFIAIAAIAILAAVGIIFIPDLLMSDDPDDFIYDIIGDKVVISSLKNDELTSVKIPAKIEGKTVYKIGEAAFSGCANLKKVRISDSVKEIDSFAFLFCENLDDIKIPNSVTKIGESVFSDCTSLKSISIPDSVKEIGPSAFQGCTSLSSVDISDSVTSIKEAAFMNCTDMKKIQLPDSVKELGGSVFEGCTSLNKVKLSSSIPEICFSAFEGCTELTEIVIPDSVKEIGDYAFSGCSSLKKAEIPASVENIVDSAFSDCTELTIYGKKGSCAEEYAQAHDIPFKAK